MAMSSMSKQAKGVEGQGPRYKEGTVTLTHKNLRKGNSRSCRAPSAGVRPGERGENAFCSSYTHGSMAQAEQL